jgi:hypothetical protein
MISKKRPKELGEELAPMPLGPPRYSLEVTRDETRVSAVRSSCQGLTISETNATINSGSVITVFTFDVKAEFWFCILTLPVSRPEVWHNRT